MKNENKAIRKIAVVGLLAALSYVCFTFLQFKISLPGGDATSIHLGNMVPVPFIILFIRRIFAWMRAHMPKLDGLVTRMEKKAEKNRAAVEKYAFWGLAILVAIPLPGTGAWTGALVAAMMEMRLKRAFPAIVIGVVIAGVIVSVVTYGAQAIFSF